MSDLVDPQEQAIAHAMPPFQPATPITHDKEICGGAARLGDTRFIVWGLVEWRQLGLADAEILGHHPSLTQADLSAAWVYYEQHRDEVDEAIRKN